MSALTGQVAREHRSWAGGAACSCGQEMPMRECGCQSDRSPYAEHVIEVTEAAVRGQVAADIRALEHTAQDVKAHVASGGSVEECDGYDRAVIVTAHVAEGTGK